jgi:hypothetical protein
MDIKTYLMLFLLQTSKPDITLSRANDAKPLRARSRYGREAVAAIHSQGKGRVGIVNNRGRVALFRGVMCSDLKSMANFRSERQGKTFIRNPNNR